MILLVLTVAYGSRKSQFNRCDTISSPQIVHTTTLDLPIGLLFLGKKETSLYSHIFSGTMSRILSYLRVVSSRQIKQGDPIAGQQSTVSETAKVPPITSGSLKCRHKALTAASNLSPQSMQLNTKVDWLANYTTFCQLVKAFPWKISMTVLPAVWKAALRAAASTLGTPTSACEQRSCLLRL